MADYNSSLPVRTENAGDVIAKIADATVTSQQLKVESDGSINVNAAFAPGTKVIITDGTDDVSVNADGSLNITDNGGSITVDGAVTVSATNLDIRDLVFATDKVDVTGSEVSLDATTLAALESITVQNGAGASAVNIQDGGNSITVDGSVTVSATDLDIRDLAFATDKVDVTGSEVSLDATTLAALESITVQNGAGASAVNIQDGGNSITVDGSVTVSATDLDIRDLTHASDSIKVGDGTTFLSVNTDGSINVRVSEANGTSSVADFDTAAAVASGANSVHTYTSTGNFYLEQIEASGSGKMKIEVKINGVTKFVQFNSTANTNMSILLKQPILVTNTQTVTVTRTNRDNQAQDVYSTVVGFYA